MFTGTRDVGGAISLNDAMRFVADVTQMHAQLRRLQESPLARHDASVQQRLSDAMGYLQTVRARAAGRMATLVPQDARDIASDVATDEDVIIDNALMDVGRWYTGLDDAHTIALTPAQTATMSCAISLQPFDALEHPVVVYAGHVVHAFEASDLLQWLFETTDNTQHPGVGLNPLTREPLPLEDIRRVRVVDVETRP